MKKIKSYFKSILNKLPYVKTLYKHSLNSAYPSGHYYSPIVSIDEIRQREKDIWKLREVDGVEGINLNFNEQKKLLIQLSEFYNCVPYIFKKDLKLRYQFRNGYYDYTDCIILFSMINNFKPKRIIEIGSGFSSAIMLDTNEFFFDNKISLTFVDPYPERLFSLMKDYDTENCRIVKSDLQLISLDVFKELEQGDFLFIDSTHVSKTGSDVNYILFEILPILVNGVHIHFHDIFYPFEYPKEWVYKGLNWNEDYILRAFLMYNQDFKIEFFADYLHKHYSSLFNQMPLCYKNTGGNLWIVKN
jgi:Methyltransferase domain